MWQVALDKECLLSSKHLDKSLGGLQTWACTCTLRNLQWQTLFAHSSG